MNSKLILGVLAVGVTAGALGIASIDDASAQKKMVALESVDADSLTSYEMLLQRLPDAGIRATCKSTVAKSDGSQKSLDAITLDVAAPAASISLMHDVCDTAQKEAIPVLK